MKARYTPRLVMLLNLNGPNVIAVEVGEGWYATRLGFLGGRRQLYGAMLVTGPTGSHALISDFLAIDEGSIYA
jgi:hypothetical protein